MPERQRIGAEDGEDERPVAPVDVEASRPAFTWSASLNSEKPAAFASRITSRVDASAVRAHVEVRLVVVGEA